MDTATGTGESFVLLLPRRPRLFKPQQYARPAAIAQVCLYPASIAVTFLLCSAPAVDTFTGTSESFMLLLPSWPRPFLPQQ